MLQPVEQPYLATLPEIIAAIQHPNDERLSFLYYVIMVDTMTSGTIPHDGDIAGAETGLCYFADSQIDRSPTGSGVTARVAVAHAKGLRSVGQRWTYNSLVSNYFGDGMFTTELVGEVVLDRIQGGKIRGVTVKVEGKAFYTGTSAFVVENEDGFADGVAS